MAVTFNAQNNVFEGMRHHPAIPQSPSFTSNAEAPAVDKTPQPAQTPQTTTLEQPAQDTVVVQEPKKKKSLWQKIKTGYTNIKKFAITTAEMTVGAAKGLFYGAIGAAGAVGVDAIVNTIKKAPKTISTKGKVIAGAIALTTMAYQLFNAKLDANAKNAEVDHRWQTGHNE